MPVNGLVFQADAVELKVRSSGSFSGASYEHTAQLTSFFTPDAENLAIGIYLRVFSLHGTSDSWQIEYQGPCAPAGGYFAGGASFRSDVSLSAVLKAYKLYANLYSKWRLVFSGVDLYVNGSFHISLGPSAEYVSNGFGPSWVPIYNGMIDIGGGATANLPPAPVVTPGVPYSWSASSEASATVSGGVRFGKAGKWYHAPAVCPPLSVEAPLCGPELGPPQFADILCAPFGLSYTQAAITSSTWGDHVQSVSTKDYASTSDEFNTTGTIDENEYSSNGHVGIVADLPKELYRLNPDDFGASVWRWAVPEVQAYSARQIALIHTGGGPTMNGAANTSKSEKVFVFDGPKGFEVG
ncbi:hypothetical protein EON79_23205, partial [bacterium]